MSARDRVVMAIGGNSWKGLTTLVKQSENPKEKTYDMSVHPSQYPAVWDNPRRSNRLARNKRECVVTADPDSSLLDQHGRARKTNVEAIVMNDQTNTQ